MAFQIDEAVLQKLVGQTYLTDATEVFGSAGPDLVNTLIDSIRAVFKELPPDQVSTQFIFVASFDTLPAPAIPEGMTSIGSGLRWEELAHYRLSVRTAATALVVVQDGRTCDLYCSAEEIQLNVLSGGTIVFVNHENIDRFVIDGTVRTLERLIPGAPSQFATPVLRDLNHALSRYRERSVQSSCRILADVWDGGRDGPRLVFRNKPEATMRSSLALFLQASLWGSSVREEHLTDERKPVDIVVNWFGTKFRALIEVKWIGKALTADSDGTHFTVYTDARVQEGAKQLVDYIDREFSSDSTVELRGYVVVFDGRRWGVTHKDQCITAKDATHYRDIEPVLERNYAEEREDIAPVVRYFLEPRSLHFLVSE